VDEAILALTIGDTEKLLSLLTTVQDVQIFCAKDEAANFAVRCNVLGALLRETARLGAELHAAERVIDVEHARYMAQRIPGAKLVELPGEDHVAFLGDQDSILDEIEQFLTGRRHAHEPERVLATVLFVDIAGSTARAATLGDHSWRELLETFYARVRQVLHQYRGREINTSGDGFLATFDGPARAVRCASAIRDTVRSLNLEVRCGLHTGECELVGNDVAGIAVHTGARVAALAAPGEVLVSQTVRDLVAGSGLVLEEYGTYTLKGVPNEWRLFRAAD